jgi:hypothetical protein
MLFSFLLRQGPTPGPSGTWSLHKAGSPLPVVGLSHERGGINMLVIICPIISGVGNYFDWQAMSPAYINFRPKAQTHRFIHQWLYTPLLGPGLFFSFINDFYTVGRTPWTSDKPVARQLPTQRTTQTQNKRAHRHACLEWDSNLRSQHSSERRQFMP